MTLINDLNRHKNKNIWSICIMILLFVIITGIMLCFRIGLFSYTEEVNTVIDLASKQSYSSNHNNVSQSSSERTSSENPQFEVVDDKGKWEMETDIELFHITYQNNEAKVTVASSDNQNVIAPGTSNQYMFHLMNTGNVALDYHMQAFVTFSQGNIADQIPLEVRLSDYTGSYLLGNKNEWVEVEKLNDVDKSSVLGANSYEIYTLEWQWPFETDRDEFDTLLGNLAVDDDLSLTVTIQVTAEYDSNQNAKGGIVKTSDTSDIFLWIVLIIASLGVLTIVIIFHKKKVDDSHEANEKSF